MTLSIDLWLLLIGAAAGAAAVYGGRGRNRLISGAVIGAVVALVLGFLRGFL
jgi:hypothetical protein